MWPATSYACSSNVRCAIGEGPLEGREEVVDLTLSKCVAHRTEDAHWLVARPERPARVCVAVVQGELGFVQRGLDPAKEVVAVGHTLSMVQSDCLGDSGGEGDAAPTGSRAIRGRPPRSRRVCHSRPWMATDSRGVRFGVISAA